MSEAVTLYVPCYNAGPFLRQQMSAIHAQKLAPSEILVIDDGSTDDSAELAASLGARVIQHSENRGLSHARNTAIQACRTPIIAALDSDCIPPPDWLSSLVPHLGRPGVVGSAGQLEESNRTDPADHWRATHMKQWWGPELRMDPPFVFGNNTVFRRDVLLEVEGYDTRYRTNCEDGDLSRRIYARGYHLLYDPSVVVHHLRKDTVDSVLRMYWRGTTTNAILERNKVALARGIASAARAGVQFLIRDIGGRRWGIIGLDIAIPWYYMYRASRVLVANDWNA